MSITRPHAVALCADNAFAMPLAASVRSLLDHTDPQDLEVYVVDCGMRPRNRARLEASWPDLDVRWIALDDARLAKVPVSGHASRANYARMLLPDLLPHVDEVLYLDSDVIVLEDVRALWDPSLMGSAVLAAQDAGAPYVNSAAVEGIELLRPHIHIPDPIRNHEALGIPAAAKYFNSGVMLIDLAIWRAENVSAQLLRCLLENRRHVRLWDQYALNVVLHGRWRELPPRWNAQVHMDRYPRWEESPYDEGTFRDVRNRPAILHYADAVKPWHHGYAHEGAEFFFGALDRTAWAGWRPPRPVLGIDWQRARRRLRKRVQRLRRLWPGSS